MREKIYFYYTNDLHSDFTYWPKVVSYFNESRRRRIKRGEPHFLVDIGDHIDRVHPIAEALRGKGNVKLLNEAKYDLVTIGNNEGITLAHEELFHLYDKANFDVVCSNLFSKTNREPKWLNRIIYKQTDSNITIAFIGLTAAFNPFYHLLNWHVADPMETLELYIKEAKKRANIIILLSHLGIHRDEAIAEEYPEIDAIIGGHTHHLLKQGKMVGNTILTAAGKHCRQVGEVILTYNHDLKKVVKREAYTTDITHQTEDLGTINTLKELTKESDDQLSTLVAKINRPLKVDWYKRTEIIDRLTATLRKWTKSDLAMLNAGILLKDLSRGIITLKDVHRICPHPINPVVVEVTGQEIKEIVRVGQTEEFMNIELKGFGFRGKKIGKLVFSGLDYVSKNLNGNKYIKDVFINNVPLEDKKIYTLATADMFIFGRILPEVAKSKRKDLFLPEFLRDLLAYTLQSEYM